MPRCSETESWPYGIDTLVRAFCMLYAHKQKEIRSITYIGSVKSSQTWLYCRNEVEISKKLALFSATAIPR